MLVKNYSVVGLHWGLYRTVDPAVVADAHAALLRLYAAGSISPLVSERVPHGRGAGGADPAGVPRDGGEGGRAALELDE